MWIGCPVLGLRPERAARFLFSKVPNPTNATLSPAFNAVVIEQSKAFRAAFASECVISASTAIFQRVVLFHLAHPALSFVLDHYN